MSFKTLKPVDCIATGTRWLLGPEGSFNASWAGQSLAFMFTGSLLKLKVGSNTMRKDPDNGRTPMIAISTAAAYNATNLWDAPTFDPCAGDELTVVDSKESIKTVVQLMLIDWASAFELEALITDSSAKVQPLLSASTPRTCRSTIDEHAVVRVSNAHSKVLFVGDSVSCGMVVSREGEPPLMPQGCLGAFPYATQRSLASRGEDMPVELVALPGVSPTEEEEAKGLIPSGGMEAKFWKMGPWSTEKWRPAAEYLSAVVIALGTNDDCMPNITPQRFAESLSSFIDHILSAYLSGPTPLPFYIIPPWIDANCPHFALAESFKSVVVRTLQDRFPDHKTLHCPIVGVVGAETVDGIHPTVKGHAMLADQLAEIFEKTGLLA